MSRIASAEHAAEAAAWMRFAAATAAWARGALFWQGGRPRASVDHVVEQGRARRVVLLFVDRAHVAKVQLLLSRGEPPWMQPEMRASVYVAAL